MKISRDLEIGLAIVLGLAGFYFMLGVLQAASLFRGARALSNANIWASAALVLYTLSLVLLARPGRLLAKLPAYARWLVAVVLVATSTYSGWQLLQALGEVDACLDQGGSYNYPEFGCDYSRSHPAMPLFSWAGLRITWTVVLLLAGIAVGVFAIREARPNDSSKPMPLRGAA